MTSLIRAIVWKIIIKIKKKIIRIRIRIIKDRANSWLIRSSIFNSLIKISYRNSRIKRIIVVRKYLYSQINSSSFNNRRKGGVIAILTNNSIRNRILFRKVNNNKIIIAVKKVCSRRIKEA